MVRFRRHFFLIVSATALMMVSDYAQDTTQENQSIIKLDPNRLILGTWRGGPEGMQEATFKFVFNGAVYIDDEKAQWEISGETEPYTVTLRYKDSIYEDEVWGLTFESDSTLMFYIGETVEILMKKVE